MKKILIISSLLLIFCASALAQTNPPKYEMRAGWVASVGNMNWPSKKGLSVEQQKAEYIKYLDTLNVMNANAIVMHIRPTADAFYPSDVEPWSLFLTGTQGQAPTPMYDPLAFMIEETHKRGMEFHAWLNPYRVSMSGDSTQFAPTHRFWQNREWFVWYGGRWYFDPGLPECREFANTMLLDLVKRYDLDAIHFDDYFYPYKVEATPKNEKNPYVEFPDDVSWEKYGKPFYANRDDWRRQNVNLLIEEFSHTIKGVKPWVKFGISPYCIWRNESADPRGSATFTKQTNYDDLYADILLWMERGWIDYVTPQLYYPTTNKNANYDVLLKWWEKNSQSDKFHTYIGLSMWNDNPELKYEIEAMRKLTDKTHGIFFWSAQVFMNNKKGLNQVLQADQYKYPSIVPPMPWLDMTPAAAPINGQTSVHGRSVKLAWDTVYSDNLMYYIVYRFAKGEVVDKENPRAIISKIFYNNDKQKTLWDESLPKGEYTYLVTSLSRNNVESAPISTTVKIK